jgi:hypothetical protein
MEYTKTTRALNKLQNIHGWFSNEAGLLIALLDEFQKSEQIEGDIFEIGVHHGKSTVFFSHLLNNTENIHVCDVFDSQKNNVSDSGKGNKDIFLDNMKKFSHRNVSGIYSCLSSELNISKIGSGFRIFHIDGGHNTNEAFYDLLLASEAIHEKGIIILDDPFRPEWPGVTEALVEFLKSYKDFVAVVVGFNKLAIARREVTNEYKKFLQNPENLIKYNLSFPISHKQLSFCGEPLFIFYVPTFIDPKSFGTMVRKALRNTFLYKKYAKPRQ